jgi:hypothetical protein
MSSISPRKGHILDRKHKEESEEFKFLIYHELGRKGENHMTQREDSLSSSHCIRLVQRNIENKMNIKFGLVHSSPM